MKTFAILMLLLCASCGSPRDDCDGVDTSQAPIYVNHGESMDTTCWTDTCCRIDYH